MKMNQRMHNLIFTAIFSFILAGIAAASFFLPDRVFSEVENRELQAMPQATIAGIADGSFGKSFEIYAQDQFPSRDLWMQVKTGFDRLIGRYDNGNVYFGSEGWLFPKEEIKQEKLEKNIRYINTYAERYAGEEIDFSLLIAPTSATVMQRYLKNDVIKVLPDEKAAIEDLNQNSNIPLCDVTQALSEHDGEYIYYRTDHHWTTLGAYYAYGEWIENYAGQKAVALEMFPKEQVADDFLGTTYSKAPLPLIKPDRIDRFDHPSGDNVTMTIADARLNEQFTQASLYNDTYLDKKDQYSYFLSGNNPVTVIKSEANTGRRLLMFKDSYGNCFVPFLTSHFDDIVVIDMRYYRNTPQELMAQYEITDVLFLYNIQTLASDNNLAYLMR